MQITLLDGDNTETYDSLEGAVAAAKAWYSNLETDSFKLPAWNYQIQNIDDLNVAIGNYKAQIAGALGIQDETQAELRFRLRAAEVRWG